MLPFKHTYRRYVNSWTSVTFREFAFIVNFISTVNCSERRIMKLHDEQVIAMLLCVMIIVCFVVVRYFEV